MTPDLSKQLRASILEALRLRYQHDPPEDIAALLAEVLCLQNEVSATEAKCTRLCDVVEQAMQRAGNRWRAAVSQYLVRTEGQRRTTWDQTIVPSKQSSRCTATCRASCARTRLRSRN